MGSEAGHKWGTEGPNFHMRTGGLSRDNHPTTLATYVRGGNEFPPGKFSVVPGLPQEVRRIKLFPLTYYFVRQHYAQQMVASLSVTKNMDTL